MDRLWTGSRLIGKNTYLLTKPLAQYETAEKTRDQAEYKAIKIPIHTTRGYRDGADRMLIRIGETSPRALERIELCVEETAPRFYRNPGFLWPYDIVGDGRCDAYVLMPFAQENYVSIRELICKPEVNRTALAAQLFARIAALHEGNASLGGFGRQHVLVEKQTNVLKILPGDGLTSPHAAGESGSYQSGFCAIPSVTEEKLESRLVALTAGERDIFSAAVIAFYLLHYTHPFIGGAFWSIPKENYFRRYMRFPDFIFGEGSENALGVMDFERMMKREWEKNSEELRYLFTVLFDWFARGQRLSKNEQDAIWNARNWEMVLRDLIPFRDAPENQTDYYLESIVHYLV